MKKIFAFFMIAAYGCMSMCACDSGTKAAGGNFETGQNTESWQNTSEKGGSSKDEDFWQGGGLRFLCSPYGESACGTENGYYYLTGDTVELRDGSYGAHLMYMDYAAGREIYLCSTAGCKHDSPDCPAVFLYDDFPTTTTKLFVFQNNLYILSREYDDDGTMSSEGINIGGDGNTVESQPAVLYRANLDGTERKEVYVFDPKLTLEDLVIGDDHGIYLITKKLAAEKDENKTYTTSTERKIVYLSLDSFDIKEICPMTFDDSVRWNVIGCYQNSFVLSGTDYGREYSREEYWDDDAYKELYNNSSEVYALLDPGEGKIKEICRMQNKYENSAKILGDSLYLSSTENQNIEAINMETGEKKTLCALKQNFIMDAIGDALCCRDWNLSEDPVFYFVNVKTGEITHSPLVIRCNGWAVEFRAQTASDILFIYDYDATDNGDGSYEIHRYKYALIAKEDLFSGQENYREIEMVGSGQ